MAHALNIMLCSGPEPRKSKAARKGSEISPAGVSASSKIAHDYFNILCSAPPLGEQSLIVRPMGPLHSPVLEKLPQSGQVPREPPPDLDAPGGGLPRSARERERHLHPSQAGASAVGTRRVAVFDRALDLLPLYVPGEVREVPGVVPSVAARAVVVHYLLEVRDAAHVVDYFEAAADALGA